MRALVKYEDGPDRLEVRDVPESVCGAGDVKIQVKACGICGTDIHILHDLYAWPKMVPLGHEYSGVVVETGEQVTRFRVGDRVTTCGRGGFGRYVVKQETERISKLPDSLSFEEAALFEPMSVCTRAVFETSGIRPLDLALVSGPGSIGLGILQAVKAAGGRAIVSGTAADDERLEVAGHLGADYTVNIERESLEELVKDLSRGQGLDVVLECSGAAAAVNTGIGLLKKGGNLVQVGLSGRTIPVNMDLVVNHRIRLVGALGFGDEEWEKSIELARIGKYDLKRMISHTLPLSAWREAFRLCEEKRGLKVLIVPD